jgi:hypothetical protein
MHKIAKYLSKKVEIQIYMFSNNIDECIKMDACSTRMHVALQK